MADEPIRHVACDVSIFRSRWFIRIVIEKDGVKQVHVVAIDPADHGLWFGTQEEWDEGKYLP